MSNISTPFLQGSALNWSVHELNCKCLWAINQHSLFRGDFMENLFLVIITDWLFIAGPHLNSTFLCLNISNQHLTRHMTYPFI